MAEFKRRSREPKKFSERISWKDFDNSGRKDSGRKDSGRRDSGRFNQRNSGRRSFDRSERTEVICDSCKKKCEVPFKPTSDKPIYCDDCFKKISGPKSNNNSKELMEINRKLDLIMTALKIN